MSFLFPLEAHSQYSIIIIKTGPPTVPCWDLNPGPLSLEESAFLTELTLY